MGDQLAAHISFVVYTAFSAAACRAFYQQACILVPCLYDRYEPFHQRAALSAQSLFLMLLNSFMLNLKTSFPDRNPKKNAGF